MGNVARERNHLVGSSYLELGGMSKLLLLELKINGDLTNYVRIWTIIYTYVCVCIYIERDINIFT